MLKPFLENSLCIEVTGNIKRTLSNFSFVLSKINNKFLDVHMFVIIAYIFGIDHFY
ncbi:hypothetical protein [Clostridium sp. Marseille-QA1073]